MRRIPFFVRLAGSDSLVIHVADDPDRPNNDDAETVLADWLHDNYGDKPYEYWRLDTCETYVI